MLEIIEIESDTSPVDAAEEFRKHWNSGSKVVVMKGRSFADDTEMREYYDLFMESAGKPGEVGEDATADNRNSAGQATGQRWTEIRYDPTIPDAYRHSANPQPLHTDGSYVPDFPDTAIIYCQAAAQNGGETIFLDSKALLAAMEEENPELLDALKKTDMTHARSGMVRDVKVIENDEEGICLAWNYYCVSDDLPEESLEIKNQFHEYLQSSGKIRESLYEVALSPGDCVMWKDYRVLHGRNGFDPEKPSERFLWKSAFHAD